MPMEFTGKKNYREHELRKDKEKWMVISFSWNKTIVTTRSNDGEREVIGCIVYIYIYIVHINVCHLKEFIVHLFATPSFHASSRNFFFSSLSYDENERLFRKDDFHRAVKSIRYRGIATRTILSRIFVETRSWNGNDRNDRKDREEGFALICWN